MPGDTNVQLVDAEGRGRVELVEQPTRRNGNVAIVRIQDPEGGTGQYSFRLAWGGGSNDPYYSSGDAGYPSAGQGGVLTPGGSGVGYGNTGQLGATSGTMQWSGRVDGRVRVTVRGNRAHSTRVSGGPVQGEQVRFGGALPRGEVDDVEIRRLQGRDDVKIIQKPSAGNGYTLIFEIDDSDGGADDYVVEVTWR
jgi:hypothetical protein